MKLRVEMTIVLDAEAEDARDRFRRLNKVREAATDIHRASVALAEAMLLDTTKDDR